MRILLVYSGHGISTVDVCRGYDKAFWQLGHEVRTFNYHHYLSFWMEALRHWKEKTGINWTHADMLRRASEQVVLDAIPFVPNVVVVITGLVLHRIAFELFHALSLPVALILTESPYLDHDQRVVAEKGRVAAVFANDKTSLENLAGCAPIVAYLPHSYDPEIHHPGRVEAQYRSDVFFCGTLYEERRELFDAVDWGTRHLVIRAAELTKDGGCVGATENKETAEFYRGAKVCVNLHRCSVGEKDGKLIQLDKPAYSLGPRSFELAGCGAFQLCDNHRPELQEVFGDTVPTFSGPQELEEKAHYYLEHPQERRQLAERQRERVAECSFVHRARQIVEPILEQIAVT